MVWFNVFSHWSNNKSLNVYTYNTQAEKVSSMKIFTRTSFTKAAFALTASALLAVLVKLLGVYSVVFPVLYVFLDMNYFLRMFWLVLKYFVLREKIELLKTSETTFYVLTTDIDLHGHMNNSRYLRECDFGRVNHWLGSDFYKTCRKHGLGLVMGAMTIRYRRSLELFQIVHLKTNIIYWDEKALYLEQKFLSNNGFVCAVATAKQSIVQPDKNKKDHVTVDQLIFETLGEQVPRPNPPREVELWIEYNSVSSLNLRSFSKSF